MRAGSIGHDPDLDPCPNDPRNNGQHSQEWIDGGRCTHCGAGSIDEVEAQLVGERGKVSWKDFNPTDIIPTERNRKHLTGIMAPRCWCKPILVPNKQYRKMLWKHNDPDKGPKGEH